uniref:Uncharacterized protein n=1 Tax=Meloidogyne enterolobii TaxID=390850 RepID=A0A6V7YAT1_MELEN|nr:unnamed protein product [Meloidogyne enterolobii]
MASHRHLDDINQSRRTLGLLTWFLKLYNWYVSIRMKRTIKHELDKDNLNRKLQTDIGTAEQHKQPRNKLRKTTYQEELPKLKFRRHQM